MASARSVLEPKFGPIEYVKEDVLPCRGLVRHLLLTPRYDVTNSGQDYRWREVSVFIDPSEPTFSVGVREVTRIKRLFLFSPHGGPWLFPPAISQERTGPEEREVLAAIFHSLAISEPPAR
jgi:hypothetical protein